MKILVFTTLYPNAVQKRHGIFVEQRLRHLLESTKVEAKVIAPVPWFPIKYNIFSSYSNFARVPREENRHGIEILHPRYPILPKIGMTISPFLLYMSMKKLFRHIVRNGYDFDVIDAHYFYPDGVAAVMLGHFVGKPVVITARGTDINLIPEYALPRKMIKWAAKHASGIVTVCKALGDELVSITKEDEKVRVLRNGVDLELFSPVDRDQQRRRLQIKRKTLLSVGHLVKRKGHDIVIKALTELPAVDLLIAGDGEEEGSLKRLVETLGLKDRVRFLGAISQQDLKFYYGAVYALVLASSREGWANVLLESMACGTPVIASDVWGTPEVVASPKAGILMENRDSSSLVVAFKRLSSSYPSHTDTRNYAEQFSWEETTQGQLELFEDILQKSESCEDSISS